MAKLLTLPLARVQDANGTVYAGAKLYAYLTGTTTPASVYTTSALNVAHLNPVVADSGGFLAPIFLDPAAVYRFRVKTAAGVDIPGMDFDPVAAEPASGIVYLSAGTGAASISVQDALRGVPITPENFRLSGETDTQAMIKWAAALGNGVNGRIDRDYTITAMATIQEKSDFTISGGGSITVANGVVADYGYSAFLFSGCSRFTLRDLTFDGNRSGRTPAELDCHTVNFYNCSNFTVENVVSDNAVCDGFMMQSNNQAVLADHCHDFRVVNCSADNCYRQGLSVVHGHDFEIAGGTYSGTNGVAPQAGIDLEALTDAPNHTIRNAIIRGVTFNDNNGRGLQVSEIKLPQNVRVLDCTFKDNDGGPLYFASDGGEVSNCYFDGFASPSDVVGAIHVPSAAGVGSFEINNPTFRRVTAAYTRPLISIGALADGNILITGTDVDTCATILAAAAPRVRFIDSRRLTPDQTLQNAIDLSGADSECSNNVITSYSENAIQMEGARPICRNNRCIEPIAHVSGSYVINITGAGGVVEGNLVYRASSGAGHGIKLDAATERLVDNCVTGFTGNPFTLTGTPVFNRGNIANGTKQTETAIV